MACNDLALRSLDARKGRRSRRAAGGAVCRLIAALAFNSPFDTATPLQAQETPENPDWQQSLKRQSTLGAARIAHARSACRAGLLDPLSSP